MNFLPFPWRCGYKFDKCEILSAVFISGTAFYWYIWGFQTFIEVEIFLRLAEICWSVVVEKCFCNSNRSVKQLQPVMRAEEIILRFYIGNVGCCQRSGIWPLWQKVKYDVFIKYPTLLFLSSRHQHLCKLARKAFGVSLRKPSIPRISLDVIRFFSV